MIPQLNLGIGAPRGSRIPTHGGALNDGLSTLIRGLVGLKNFDRQEEGLAEGNRQAALDRIFNQDAKTRQLDLQEQQIGDLAGYRTDSLVNDSKKIEGMLALKQAVQSSQEGQDAIMNLLNERKVSLAEDKYNNPIADPVKEAMTMAALMEKLAGFDKDIIDARGERGWWDPADSEEEKRLVDQKALFQSILDGLSNRGKVTPQNIHTGVKTYNPATGKIE